MYPTSEETIRAAVKARLVSRHDGDLDAFVVEELPVSRGDTRVDLAAINGRIEGYEIKSSLDNLDRLPRQVGLYGQAMERMTLAVAEEHALAAMEIIPDWWTAWCFSSGPRGGLAIRRLRRGRLNPTPASEGMLALLERDELVSLLAFYGQDRGLRTAPYPVLSGHAASSLSRQQVADGVQRLLKIRIRIEAEFGNTAFGRSAVGAAIIGPTGGVPAGSCAGASVHQPTAQVLLA